MDKDFLRQIDQASELFSSTNKPDDEILVCECFCISIGEIREICESQGTFDLETVQNHSRLGSGCKSCLKRIDSLIDKIF